MNIEQAKDISMFSVYDVSEGKARVTGDMPLTCGGLAVSMKLVEICPAVEDLVDAHGFEFDWTSGAAMSKSRSLFRNVTIPAEEFANQSET